MSRVTALDVRGSKRRGIVVDDLGVSREEQQRVVVLGEGVDGGEDELEIDVIVREGDASVVGPVERVCRSIDVEGEIYAGVGERVHAGIVVGRVVDGVDAHGVDAQLLEVLDVACAARRVGYGVGERAVAWTMLAAGGTEQETEKPTGLVVYASDVESLVVGEEGIALDGDWRGVRVADCGGGPFGERPSEGGRDQRRREKKSRGALHDC